MARKKATSRSTSRSTTSSDRTRQAHNGGAARFVPPWLLAGAPLAGGTVLHTMWGTRAASAAFATLGLGVATAALTWLAWGIGGEARRRRLIRWHTTVTVAAGGVAVIVTMVVGPAALWLQVAGATAVVFAVSWNLRGFDALRSDTEERDDHDGGLKEALGLGQTRFGKAQQVGARREVDVFHGPGETVEHIQGALKAIESAAHVPPGRSRVLPDPDNASRSKLVLVQEDVLKTVVPWPGPSTPNGSILDPLQVGRYEDDEVAQLWLPATTRGSNGPPRPPTNLLFMGMTRAGKTLCALIMLAEILTRRDVVVLYADAAKGSQTAGPIRGGLTLYADTVGKTRVLFKRLKNLVKARADKLGQAGYRQWEPDCFYRPNAALGEPMPMVVVHLEEADEYAGTDEFVWLVGKCLSAGVAISVSMQRADHSSMPTGARFNIGAALCFGCGDDYSAAFALSDSTIQAGAHPENWKNRKPGYAYLEAPGVEEDRFPVPLRAYFATDAQLTYVVNAYTPIRATLDTLSQEALGDAWTVCQPGGHSGGVPEPHQPGGSTMVTSDDDFDMDDDNNIRAEVLAMRADVDEEYREQFADPERDPRLDNIDTQAEIPAYTGPDQVFEGEDGAKPDALSPEQATAALDTILIRWAAEGKAEFTVDALVKAYPYRSRSWMSRRLSALAEDETIVPPGLALVRDDDRLGVYHLHLLATAGARPSGLDHPLTLDERSEP